MLHSKFQSVIGMKYIMSCHEVYIRIIEYRLLEELQHKRMGHGLIDVASDNGPSAQIMGHGLR